MANPKNTSISSAKQLEIDIPDKKYFTIGEVSEICDLKAHVLRYWEQVFDQLEPVKRSTRRYYQRKDIELVIEIRSLLHDQGFTIPGAKARLAKGKHAVTVEAPKADDSSLVGQLQNLRTEIAQFKRYIQTKY
ncbi:MerR family transcriptional regulator [Thiosulfativibrio zosterae]|uniref:MerR family transcriptional regulator n=1 Tax=Thiosulfativibrio zosterae TaxID=2675053 RepID=A0A6F8PLS2_9GAMM|nr:MerR family transcriptional regulator [Thiosulfativibrio zosterae]BBP43004.1 MerR family transcriptional regulator [Thiosulfativibrio zosterae]